MRLSSKNRFLLVIAACLACHAAILASGTSQPNEVQQLINHARVTGPSLDRQNILSARQLDGALRDLHNQISAHQAALASVNQIRITFAELFPNLDEHGLIPLTTRLITDAPAATFRDVKVYDRSGKERGVIKRKYRRPNTASGGPSTINGFIAGVMLASGTHLDETAPFGLSQGSYNLRWSDVKDRVVFEISAEKLSEDATFEKSRW